MNAEFIEEPDVIFMVTITFFSHFPVAILQEVIDAETALKLDGLKTKVLELHALLRRKSAEADGQEELLKRAKEGSFATKSASEELSSELQKITLDVLSKRCKALEVRELSNRTRSQKNGRPPQKQIWMGNPPKQETAHELYICFFLQFLKNGALQMSHQDDMMIFFPLKCRTGSFGKQGTSSTTH